MDIISLHIRGYLEGYYCLTPEQLLSITDRLVKSTILLSGSIVGLIKTYKTRPSTHLSQPRIFCAILTSQHYTIGIVTVRHNELGRAGSIEVQVYPSLFNVTT